MCLSVAGHAQIVDNGVVKHVAVDEKKLKDTGGEAALSKL